MALVLNFFGVVAYTSQDGREVAARISATLSKRFGVTVHVTCPHRIPEKKGGIEDCEANAGNGTTLVRVVQDDSRGHSHFDVDDPTVLAPAAAGNVDAAGEQPSSDADTCPAATYSLLQSIKSRPAPGVDVLDLPRGVEVTVGGVRYVIAAVDLVDSDEAVHDQFSATWAVEGGRILTYDDDAAEVTSWPPQPREGLTSATSMSIEYCRDRLRLDHA